MLQKFGRFKHYALPDGLTRKKRISCEQKSYDCFIGVPGLNIEQEHEGNDERRDACSIPCE